MFLLQAHDDDQPHTDNSKVRYNITSISEPESIVQLRIDEISGSVFLDAPVDFEKLQNNTGVSGEVKVTVEGRDLGDPSLSNTTTLVLSIQVVYMGRSRWVGQRVQTPEPLKNKKNVGFLSLSQNSMLGHHRHASEMPFK